MQKLLGIGKTKSNEQEDRKIEGADGPDPERGRPVLEAQKLKKQLNASGRSRSGRTAAGGLGRSAARNAARERLMQEEVPMPLISHQDEQVIAQALGRTEEALADAQAAQQQLQAALSNMTRMMEMLEALEGKGSAAQAEEPQQPTPQPFVGVNSPASARSLQRPSPPYVHGPSPLGLMSANSGPVPRTLVLPQRAPSTASNQGPGSSSSVGTPALPLPPKQADQQTLFPGTPTGSQRHSGGEAYGLGMGGAQRDSSHSSSGVGPGSIQSAPSSARGGGGAGGPPPGSPRGSISARGPYGMGPSGYMSSSEDGGGGLGQVTARVALVGPASRSNWRRPSDAPSAGTAQDGVDDDARSVVSVGSQQGGFQPFNSILSDLHLQASLGHVPGGPKLAGGMQTPTRSSSMTSTGAATHVSNSHSARVAHWARSSAQAAAPPSGASGNVASPFMYLSVPSPYNPSSVASSRRQSSVNGLLDDAASSCTGGGGGAGGGGVGAKEGTLVGTLLQSLQSASSSLHLAEEPGSQPPLAPRTQDPGGRSTPLTSAQQAKHQQLMARMAAARSSIDSSASMATCDERVLERHSAQPLVAPLSPSMQRSSAHAGHSQPLLQKAVRSKLLFMHSSDLNGICTSLSARQRNSEGGFSPAPSVASLDPTALEDV